jgi:hypothetical protein
LKEWGPKLDIKSNEIKYLGTKLRKKINQEKNKNIVIKTIMTKKGLWKKNAIKSEGTKLQEKIIIIRKKKYKTQK